MKIQTTTLPGVLTLSPDIYSDARGQFVETWNAREFREFGLDFVQDDISLSWGGVLRGIHGDPHTTKLVQCLLGAYYLVVIDLRPDSWTWGKWQAFDIDDRNRMQVLVPAGFGNACYAIERKNLFSYKQTAHYDRDSQLTYRYDDPRFNITWPKNPELMSVRDDKGPFTP